MKANNILKARGTKRCLFCKKPFIPHHKVKERQNVCRDKECQLLRQKINQIDWLDRNPDYYQDWYQKYGIAWQQEHPNYLKEYRRRKKAQQLDNKQNATDYKQCLELLHKVYQAEKKEELTSIITNNSSKIPCDKKEELTNCFYLVKAKELVLFPLIRDKKEELAYC